MRGADSALWWYSRIRRTRRQCCRSQKSSLTELEVSFLSYIRRSGRCESRDDESSRMLGDRASPSSLRDTRELADLRKMKRAARSSSRSSLDLASIW